MKKDSADTKPHTSAICVNLFATNPVLIRIGLFPVFRKSRGAAIDIPRPNRCVFS